MSQNPQLARSLGRPISAALDAAAPRRAGFFEKALLDGLSNMTLGCLHLERPDGSHHLIGTPGAEISCRIRVNRDQFFQRCVLFGDIGFGEGYMDGDWDTDDITQVISWFILNIENSPSMSGSKVKGSGLNLLRFANRLQHLLRPNSVEISRRNIREHYDLGNEFYRLWLDSTMTYSSAYFTEPSQSLEAAQAAKYDALCRRLQLKATDHVLEIGSGWGGFACHAATNYGCRVTTVTISEEQFKFSKERFIREGVADRVEIRLQDYRLVEGRFDKIASIEMLEAVGDAYVDTYFAKCASLLKPDGLLAFQVIICPDSRYEALRKGVDWIQKYIFPGSLLLSVARINQAVNRTSDLTLHGFEDMGLHYAKTLNLWHERFNQVSDQVRGLGFDHRFIRKWNYYLCYCEAAFAMHNISVIQAVYTRPNNPQLRASSPLQ
ncbi:MAG: class I SAM-dependent methyltransferase [Opitutaceae bacterium]|nr:class I SAM-dependent methyltransferase [Verrucomicrobiales bacterium]